MHNTIIIGGQKQITRRATEKQEHYF
jgi:hypothetical protein